VAHCLIPAEDHGVTGIDVDVEPEVRAHRNADIVRHNGQVVESEADVRADQVNYK